jgi:hypothetical protein
LLDGVDVVGRGAHLAFGRRAKTSCGAQLLAAISAFELVRISGHSIEHKLRISGLIAMDESSAETL